MTSVNLDGILHAPTVFRTCPASVTVALWDEQRPSHRQRNQVLPEEEAGAAAKQQHHTTNEVPENTLEWRGGTVRRGNNISKPEHWLALLAGVVLSIVSAYMSKFEQTKDLNAQTQHNAPVINAAD